MDQPHGTGANPSPKDIRTFAYAPSARTKTKGGERYKPEDIDDQHKVGICTGISLTQLGQKATHWAFSPDFQYLLQKREIDKNWEEGSSISSALKVAKNFGRLPLEFWTHTDENDRKLPYHKYIEKLKKIPEEEIARLKDIASGYKIRAYAKVPADYDSICNAIDEADGEGVLARFDIGSEWWREPIEPLRRPQSIVSGHATIITNYNGLSMRIANTWGEDWADKGTAYFLWGSYKPTEVWITYEDEVPEHVENDLKKLETLQGKLLSLLQELLKLLQ